MRRHGFGAPREACPASRSFPFSVFSGIVATVVVLYAARALPAIITISTFMMSIPLTLNLELGTF